MKLIKYLSLLLLSVCLANCGENIIEYDTTTVADDLAEFQIHYMVPIANNATNNIVMIKINDVIYNTNTSPLVPYNAMPMGAVGLFYTVKAGITNIKLYKDVFDASGSYVETIMVYDKNTELKPGKQNIFIHDFEQDPVVIENGYPFTKRAMLNTDTICHVKFYNFIYDTEGVPYDQPVQYQYQYIYNPLYVEGDSIPPGYSVGSAVPSDKQITSPWINCGPPCHFGESSGWVEVPVKKTVFNSSGYASISLRITIEGTNGQWNTLLQYRPQGTRYITYNVDAVTWYIGRYYNHIFAGYRTCTTGKGMTPITRCLWQTL
jgi:hypothetical protein